MRFFSTSKKTASENTNTLFIDSKKAFNFDSIIYSELNEEEKNAFIKEVAEYLKGYVCTFSGVKFVLNGLTYYFDFNLRPTSVFSNGKRRFCLYEVKDFRMTAYRSFADSLPVKYYSYGNIKNEYSYLSVEIA